MAAWHDHLAQRSPAKLRSAQRRAGNGSTPSHDSPGSAPFASSGIAPTYDLQAEARHGDVDINGDLVDALDPRRKLDPRPETYAHAAALAAILKRHGTPSQRAFARERRLADAIDTDARPELAPAQLETVRRMLARVPA